MKKYKAQVHWAKLEISRSQDGSIDDEKLVDMRRHLRTSFPVKDFNVYRNELDPENILSNNFIGLLFLDSPNDKN